jgi:hypothetical protein
MAYYKNQTYEGGLNVIQNNLMETIIYDRRGCARLRFDLRNGALC